MADSENVNKIKMLKKPSKTPRDRFLQVAPKRTQRALDAIRLLGRCGNRATYQYEQKEVEKIFRALEDELARARSRFDGGEPTLFQL